ncbi:hypothetical protein R5R35_000871 [Gryllus longicercus]
MYLKYLMYCTGRHNYSVGKNFIHLIKDGKPYRSFHFNSKCVLRKVAIQDLSVKRSINESFDYAIEKTEEKLTPKKRNTVPKRKVVDEILGYLKKSFSPEVINAVPHKYLRRNKNTDQMYLIVPDVADTIVQCMKDNILKKNHIVLETNPGLGVLTKKLIDAGVEQLHLHEPSTTFNKILKKFYSFDSDKVNIHSTDFLTLWKIHYQDKMDDGSRLQDILSHYPKMSWSEEPYLKIIGCIQSPNFIKHLILSIVFQSGIMTHCRPELYIIVPPTLHRTFTCTGKDGYIRYRSISVLFQLFFDYELLEKLPRKAFVPWAIPMAPKKRKIDEISALNDEWLYLMKIVPKKNLYETVPAEKLPALWYFVRHHFWSRSSRVIREMESWIPGCGVRLVLEGYNIFTEFGDLKPSEVLRIFQLFSEWPEYQDCSFLSSLETALLKLDENSSDKLENEGSDDEAANEDNEDRR